MRRRADAGIGNSISGLELRSGIAGSNGDLFTSLSGNATLTNGTLTGSVPLTSTQAQQLMRNPSAFYLQASNADFPSGAVRAQFGTVANEYYFPVTGSVQGANGSRWETSLSIFNTSYGLPATVTVQRLASGAGGNSNADGSMNASNTTVITVPARGTLRLDAAIQSLFGQSNSLGAPSV